MNRKKWAHVSPRQCFGIIYMNKSVYSPKVLTDTISPPRRIRARDHIEAATSIRISPLTVEDKDVYWRMDDEASSRGAVPTIQDSGFAFQNLYQQMMDYCFDEFESPFPMEGRFILATVKGRGYWYFDGRTSKREYIGPASDPDIAKIVEDFKSEKSMSNMRRRIVGALLRNGGYMQPHEKTGAVISAIAATSFFKDGGVLMGEAAFQIYPSMMGYRASGFTTMAARDIPIELYETGAGVDAVEDLNSVRTAVSLDQTFEIRPAINRDSGDVHLVNSRGLEIRVRSLMPGAFIGNEEPDVMTLAQFLTRDPHRAVLLHGAGISLNIPDPSRYAVHRLIMASRRTDDVGGVAERGRDILQASLLVRAVVSRRNQEDLAIAFREAWQNGQSWQGAIRTGMSYLPVGESEYLLDGVTEGLRRLGESADDLDDFHALRANEMLSKSNASPQR